MSNTCYIIAWIRERNGQFVVEEAGLYGEGPETITHYLLTEVPVIVLSFSGSSYAAARELAINYIKNDRCPPNSVISRVLKMVLIEEERRTKIIGEGSFEAVVQENKRLRQGIEELKQLRDDLNEAMQRRSL